MSQGHARLALAAAAASAGVLLPAFFFLAPSSRWQPLSLFLVLATLSVISYVSSVAIKREVILDASYATSLVALVVLGPLPAMTVWIAVGVLHWLVMQRPVTNLLANIASYGWAVLAASAALSAIAGGWPPSLQSGWTYAGAMAAGMLSITVNFLVGAVIVAWLAEGQRLASVTRGEFINAIPNHLVTTALGLLSIFLYTQIGILALAIFAAIVLIPQLLLPILLRPKPVGELSHSEAVGLYAEAVADMMKLGDQMKRILHDAAHHIDGPEAPAYGRSIGADYIGGDFHDVVEAVLYYREHWDSPDGFPGGIGGEMIPLPSRILAVADHWAQLTASGAWTVTHAQAMNKIRERSGVQYDPRVVAAAARVVETEHMGLTDNQPEMHRVPLPRLLRRIPGLAEPLPDANHGT